MPNNIFACRPLGAMTMQYCANDVMYLLALYDAYTKKTDSRWIEKVIDESARRVVEACGPAAYGPQSEAKKLGPWGSGLEKELLTMDELLDKWEEDRMDAMQRDMLGYYDYYDLDDYPMNSKDAVWDDTFDSRWEK